MFICLNVLISVCVSGGVIVLVVVGFVFLVMVIVVDVYCVVQVKFGEIVMLCNVVMCLVYCQVLFGVVLIVNFLFKYEIDSVLGIGEFFDVDYVSFDVLFGVGQIYVIIVEYMVGNVLGGVLGVGLSGCNEVVLNGMSQVIVGFMGVVGGMMCSIGDQVQGVFLVFLGMIVLLVVGY